MAIIKTVASAGAGEATNIAVQAFNSSEIVTAVRTGADKLKLIGWHTGDNKITRAADSAEQAGAVSLIALSLLGRHAVTAVRNGSGVLELISWSIPPSWGVSSGSMTVLRRPARSVTSR
jgi:hypothetical protein